MRSAAWVAHMVSGSCSTWWAPHALFTCGTLGPPSLWNVPGNVGECKLTQPLGSQKELGPNQCWTTLQ